MDFSPVTDCLLPISLLSMVADGKGGEFLFRAEFCVYFVTVLSRRSQPLLEFRRLLSFQGMCPTVLEA